MTRRLLAASTGLLLPRFKAVTTNVISLSAYATNAAGLGRRRRVARLLNELGQTHDVLHIQETKLGGNDHRYLDNLFPNHICYYNNLNAKSAGVATLVSKRLAKQYRIEATSPKGPLEGRTVILRLTDSAGEKAPFTLANVYFPSGTNMQAKNKAICCLRRYLQPELTFLSGDFNFVDKEEDGPTLLQGEARESWTALLADLSLRELEQGTHTYAGAYGGTAKLDRHYSNMDEMDAELVDCYAFVQARRTHSNPKNSLFRGGCGTTDHLPVSMVVERRQETTKQRLYNIPKWIAEEPEFIERFYDKWLLTEKWGMSPFEQLRMWKKCVTQASKAYFRLQKWKSNTTSNGLAALSVISALNRLLAKETQDRTAINSLLRKHEWLGKFLDRGGPRWTAMGLKQLSEEITLDLTEMRKKETDIWHEVDKAQLGRAGGWWLMKDLKQSVPNARARLVAVKEEGDTFPVTDRNEIAKRIYPHWRKVWIKRNLNAPDPYLDSCGYEAIVPDDKQPVQSTVEDYMELIAGTNDSCSGPDGIPFAVYRSLAYTIAPILQKVETALGEGYLPPTDLGFNYARLFLIPKNHTLHPLDHRPISVTNADNRIIAQAVAHSFLPALGTVLTDSQRGFRPGISGEEHILALTRYYYSRLSAKQQTYILFMDIRKAFDSVSHDFIRSMLERMKIAPWFYRLISALLTDIKVTPVLGQDTPEYIDIDSGVKQGCPLSPLLFILCYDPLLKNLHEIEGVHPKAYADDLAAASEHMEGIVKTFNVFRKYGAASGLRMNKGKTKILSALPMSKVTRSYLNLCGYEEIEEVDRMVYLGVLIGRIGTEDVYEKALQKFQRRTCQLAPLISRSSLEKRIVIFNVFLLPIFSYLTQFYIVPPRVYNSVKEVCRKRIIPYNGSAFAYAHLTVPTKADGGFNRPLRDLWASNMTQLAIKANLHDSDGRREAHMEGFEHVNRVDWGTRSEFASMVIDEHRAYAGFQFLEDYGPKNQGIIRSKHIHDDPKGRKLVYKAFALNGWSDVLCTQDPRSLRSKLKKWGIFDMDSAQNLRKHAKNVGRRTYLWNHQLRLAFNALPFDRRIRHFVKEAAPPRPCFFCGQGEDSTYHVYVSCELLNEARTAFHAAYSVLPQLGVNNVMLACLPISALHTRITLAFNYSVWRTRKDYLEVQNCVPPRGRLITRLLRTGFMHMDRKHGGNGQKPSLGRRISESTPEGALLIYTDGSARPNPGPAGSGVYSLLTPSRPRSFYANLGYGTNNMAEIFAIGMAIELICKHDALRTLGSRYIILSDSSLAINVIKNGTKSKDSRELARSVRTKLRGLRIRTQVNFVWVKGHEGISGNEFADTAAAKGASISACDVNDAALLDLAIEHNYFTALQMD